MFNFQRQFARYQDAEGNTGSSGGGTGDSGNPADDGANSGAGGTALSQNVGDAGAGSNGAPNALAQSQVDEAAKYNHAPEKYRVMGTDGAFDLAATLEKTAKGYAELDKARGKAQGFAPESPGDYKIEVPKELEGQFDTEDAGFKDFVEAMHGVGSTPAQVNAAAQAYFKWAGKFAQGVAEVSTDECNEAIAKIWTDPAQRAQNYKSADRALRSFAGERYGELQSKYGNDPDFIWFVNNIGQQMGEDSPPAGAGGGQSNSVDRSQILNDLGSDDPAVRVRAEKQLAASRA